MFSLKASQQVGAHDLDRNIAFNLRVKGPVDDTHRTLTDDGLNAIPSNS